MNANEDSRSERGLSNFAKVLIVLVLVVATVFAFELNRAIERANGVANIATTKTLLMNCRVACLSFYTNANRWPIALPELIANTNGIVYIKGVWVGWRNLSLTPRFSGVNRRNPEPPERLQPFTIHPNPQPVEVPSSDSPLCVERGQIGTVPAGKARNKGGPEAQTPSHDNCLARV